ncbi:ferredoxin-thioredoxin reductase variable chain [Moorena bouillonii]|uniref:ferredoxin-thioredoxin reductase variable chain n=1 Tax=Moorena bouillonii TaxID=207920 RepID=UPI00117E930B
MKVGDRVRVKESISVYHHPTDCNQTLSLYHVGIITLKKNLPISLSPNLPISPHFPPSP